MHPLAERSNRDIEVRPRRLGRRNGTVARCHCVCIACVDNARENRQREEVIAEKDIGMYGTSSTRGWAAVMGSHIPFAP